VSITPPADDERTRMPEGTHGAPASASPAIGGGHNELPAGTRLGEFEITGLVGVGGFGIVYLGYDHSLQRTVAIKEYMPSALAARVDGTTVAVRSARHADTFKAGLKSFVNEARLLAQFDHPALIKVYRFWEANGTAYMVMPFYEGPTLKQALAERGDAPDEKWLKRLLHPLLDALEVMHSANCFHRDIAPDNILLLKDNRPLLLDFGAARRVIGDMNQALTVIVKAGYAPLEQYAENPSLRQGAWTDLYALASVFYFAIMREPPTPALARMRVDPLVPLAQAAKGRYSDSFLRALDAALAVEPENRPQSIAEWRALLDADVAALPARDDALDTRDGLPVTGASMVSAAPGGSRRGLWLVVAIVALVAIGAGAYWWSPWETKPAVVATPSTPSAPPKSSAPATALPSTPATTAPTPMPAPPAASVSPSIAPPTAPPSTLPSRPFDPANALAEVYAARDPSFAVDVTVDKPRVRINQDYLRFTVASVRDGYVYVLVVGTNQSDFLLLFPNAADRNNRIAAGTPLTLPRASWPMRATGPAGTDRFVVIVSERPRDFAGLGMQKVDVFGRFPEQAARVSSSGRGSPFAGKPVCPGGPAIDCGDAYGAAEFAIEETSG
jgi:serine/threonine protein kinase